MILVLPQLFCRILRREMAVEQEIPVFVNELDIANDASPPNPFVHERLRQGLCVRDVEDVGQNHLRLDLAFPCLLPEGVEFLERIIMHFLQFPRLEINLVTDSPLEKISVRDHPVTQTEPIGEIVVAPSEKPRSEIVRANSLMLGHIRLRIGVQQHGVFLDGLQTNPPWLVELHILPQRLPQFLVDAEKGGDLFLLIAAFADNPSSGREKDAPDYTLDGVRPLGSKVL